MCLDLGISQYCCLPHFTVKGRTCAVLPAMPSGRHAGCANAETAWLHKLLNHLSKCLPSFCTVPGSSSNLEQRINHVHVQSPGNLVLKGHKVGRDKNRQKFIPWELMGNAAKNRKQSWRLDRLDKREDTVYNGQPGRTFFLRSILIHQEMLSGKNSREKDSLCSGQEVGPWLVHSDFSNGKQRGKRWEGMSWSKGELLGQWCFQAAVCAFNLTLISHFSVGASPPLCMYVFVYECVCVCLHAHVCTYIWRPQDNFQYHALNHTRRQAVNFFALQMLTYPTLCIVPAPGLALESLHGASSQESMGPLASCQGQFRPRR